MQFLNLVEISYSQYLFDCDTSRAILAFVTIGYKKDRILQGDLFGHPNCTKNHNNSDYSPKWYHMFKLSWTKQKEWLIVPPPGRVRIEEIEEEVKRQTRIVDVFTQVVQIDGNRSSRYQHLYEKENQE